MLKQQRKKQVKPTIPSETDSEAVTCGACGHKRAQTAGLPEWQCPCCGTAYAGVNAEDEVERLSRQELRRLNQQYLERKKRAEKASLTSLENDHPAIGGIGLGLATYLSGLGSACTAAVGNPIVQGVGIAIILGSIVWGLSGFF